MSEDWKKTATDKFKETAKSISDAAAQVRLKYENSEVKGSVDKVTKSTMDYLDEKGVTAKAAELGVAVDKHFTTLSGQRLLELVEERLTLQARYNDVLATRLDEALKKIGLLEAAIESIKKTE